MQKCFYKDFQILQFINSKSNDNKTDGNDNNDLFGTWHRFLLLVYPIFILVNF
jgi:hypothetical protein